MSSCSPTRVANSQTGFLHSHKLLIFRQQLLRAAITLNTAGPFVCYDECCDAFLRWSLARACLEWVLSSVDSVELLIPVPLRELVSLRRTRQHVSNLSSETEDS